MAEFVFPAFEFELSLCADCQKTMKIEDVLAGAPFRFETNPPLPEAGAGEDEDSGPDPMDDVADQMSRNLQQLNELKEEFNKRSQAKQGAVLL